MCIILKEETISTYLVKYDLLGTGVILKRYLEDCLIKSNKTDKVSNTSVIFRGILIANSWNFLFLLLLLQVLYCTEFSPNHDEIRHYMFCHIYDIAMVKTGCNKRVIACKQRGSS